MICRQKGDNYSPQVMMANKFDRNGASSDSSGGIGDDIGGQCSDLSVRGKSKSPWLLNKSHRSNGDVSVMVSRFFVCRRWLLGKRDEEKKMTLTLHAAF